MKKRNLQRIFAAFIASAMAMNLAACKTEEAPKPAETPAPSTSTNTGTKEEPKEITPVDPYAGVDLGGMEIIIRDWWSGEGNAEATNQYQEDTQAFREEMMKKYNFTVKQVGISDWGSVPSDFVDYVTSDGDDTNYAFVLYAAPAVTSAMSSGLMYDLSKIKYLDFNDDLFARNKVHELYTTSTGVYAMAAGFSEPRTGVYFNNNVLKDAGIDPNSIYDMQANGTWTWDAYEQIMAKCQRDLDNDGVDDIYGLTLNESNMTNAAVFSNNGSYVGVNKDGYYYNLENPNTVEALEWCVDIYNKFDNHDPEGAQWDYYKDEFKSGKVASLVDDGYCATAGNLFADTDFDLTFVMFPKGPKASTYVNVWSNNLVVIPACYSADRAEKIAFAWMLYNTPAPGYEDYTDLSNYRAGNFDERSVTETIPMMMEGEHGTVNLAGVIPSLDLGPDLTWGIAPGAVVSEKIEAIAETWKTYINAANGK